MRLLSALIVCLLPGIALGETVLDCPLPPDAPAVRDDEPDILIWDGFLPTIDQLVPEMVQVTQASGGEPRILLASRRGGRLFVRGVLHRRAARQEIRAARVTMRTGGSVSQALPAAVPLTGVPRQDAPPLSVPTYFAAPTTVCGPNGCFTTPTARIIGRR